MDFISNRANTIAYELKYMHIAMRERGVRGVLSNLKAIAKRQKDIHQLYRLHASFAFQIAMNNELGFEDGLTHLKIAEKSAVKALSLSPRSIEYRLFYVVVRYQKAKMEEELIGDEKKKKGGGYLLKRKNLIGEILGIVNDQSPQQPNWVNEDRPSFVEYTKNCALSVMSRILAEINLYKAEQAKEKEEGSNSKRKKTQNNNNNRSNKKKKKEKEKGKKEITNPNDPMGCSSTTPAANDPMGCSSTTPAANDPMGCSSTTPAANDPMGCSSTTPAANDPMGCSSTTPAVVPSNLQSAPVTMNPPATDATSDAESTCR